MSYNHMCQVTAVLNHLNALHLLCQLKFNLSLHVFVKGNTKASDSDGLAKSTSDGEEHTLHRRYCRNAEVITSYFGLRRSGKS